MALPHWLKASLARKREQSNGSLAAIVALEAIFVTGAKERNLERFEAHAKKVASLMFVIVKMSQYFFKNTHLKRSLPFLNMHCKVKMK